MTENALEMHRGAFLVCFLCVCVLKLQQDAVSKTQKHLTAEKCISELLQGKCVWLRGQHLHSYWHFALQWQFNNVPPHPRRCFLSPRSTVPAAGTLPATSEDLVAINIYILF